MVLIQRDKARFILFGTSYLDARSYLADFGIDRFSCGRIAEETSRYFTGRYAKDGRMECFVEGVHRIHPIFLTRSDFIKVLFLTGSEVVTQYFGELLNQEIVGETSQIRGQQFLRVMSRRFCFLFVRHMFSAQGQEVVFAFLSRNISSLHVAALLDCFNDSGIGGRTTDAEFLHLSYQCCFVVAIRRFGESLLRHNLFAFQGSPFLHLRQNSGIRFRFIVRGLDVHSHETVKENHFSTCDKVVRKRVGCYFYTRALHLRICHLAGDSTFPNEFIQPSLILIGSGIMHLHICRSDGFVCLLRALAGGMVLASAMIVVSILRKDFLLCGGDCQSAEVHRVGTHIGDMTGFVQGLRQTHGLRDRELEFSRCLLLKGTGSEGRSR